MPGFRPLTPGLLPEAREFLAHPKGLHTYLESRLDSPDEGEGLVYPESGPVRGFAWMGKGRNLCIAGDSPAFVTALAELAIERETDWLMLVGPWAPASEFLGQYFRGTARRPRLDRSQVFYTQTRRTLTRLSEPGLQRAGERDVEELVPVSARMSSEDFEIDYWRIDKGEVRRRLRQKVREGRCWVLRNGGRIVFKADVAVDSPNGAQVEGVYTSEDHRGRGIASRCMAELGRRLLPTTGLLTLHVASRNAAARKAYERAGYRPGEKLRLAIFPYTW